MSEELRTHVGGLLKNHDSIIIHSVFRSQVGRLIFYKPCIDEISRANFIDQIDYFADPKRLSPTEAIDRQRFERRIFSNIYRVL